MTNTSTPKNYTAEPQPNNNVTFTMHTEAGLDVLLQDLAEMFPLVQEELLAVYPLLLTRQERQKCLEELGTGNRGQTPPSNMLTADDWFILSDGTPRAVAQVAMKTGYSESALGRQYRRARSGQVIRSKKAPLIFDLLKDGYEPAEVAEELNVPLDTALYAYQYMTAQLVRKNAGKTALPIPSAS